MYNFTSLFSNSGCPLCSPPFLLWCCASAYFLVLHQFSVLPLCCASHFSNRCTGPRFLLCSLQWLVSCLEILQKGENWRNLVGVLCRMLQQCMTTRNLRCQWCRRGIVDAFDCWQAHPKGKDASQTGWSSHSTSLFVNGHRPRFILPFSFCGIARLLVFWLPICVQFFSYTVLPLFPTTVVSTVSHRVCFNGWSPAWDMCRRGRTGKTDRWACSMRQCCMTTRNSRCQWCRRWLLVGGAFDCWPDLEGEIASATVWSWVRELELILHLRSCCTIELTFSYIIWYEVCSVSHPCRIVASFQPKCVLSLRGGWKASLTRLEPRKSWELERKLCRSLRWPW